jgi:hypothetical protein
MAKTSAADSLAAALAKKGASVWQVDLLDALMLERTAEAIRNMDGDPVASLLEAAVGKGRRPIVLVASDRMAVPLLKGLREWQLRVQSGGWQSRRSARCGRRRLFFPNLYRGTPVAGEDPELMEIVAATNMPLMIMQPALGSNRTRLPDLLKTLHAAGSPAYSWLVPEVRDYYLLQTEKPQSESLQAMAGKVPTPVEQAIRATPDQLLMPRRVCSPPARNRQKPLAMREAAQKASAPAYGLIERPRQPAPGFSLVDAYGKSQNLSQSQGRHAGQFLGHLVPALRA